MAEDSADSGNKKLVGSVASQYRVAKDGKCYLFLFRNNEDETLHNVKDVIVNREYESGMLPAYSVYITYEIEVNDADEIVSCQFKKRLSYPLKGGDIKKALINYSPPSILTEGFRKNVASVFRGACKKKFKRKEEMEDFLPSWLHYSANRLLHCHFEPLTYYQIASYLDMHQLVGKDEQLLLRLKNVLCSKPWLLCFINSTIYSMPEFKGIGNMTIGNLKRWCCDQKKDSSDFMTPIFETAVYVHNCWQKLLETYGQTLFFMPKEPPAKLKPHVAAAVQFLIQHKIIAQMDAKSYCLKDLYNASCEIVLKALKALYKDDCLPEPGSSKKLKSCETSKCVPIVCIRSTGSNYYEELKQFVSDVTADDVLVLCPTAAHVRRMQDNTDFNVTRITTTDISHLVQMNIDATPKVLVIDGSQLWGVVDFANSLKEWILNSSSTVHSLVIVGDERELCGIGVGSVFTSIASCTRFPVLYALTPPKTWKFGQESFNTFSRGTRIPREQRTYNGINFMTKTEFMSSSTVRAHCVRPIGGPLKTKFFCNSFEMKRELEPCIHNIYDTHTTFEPHVFYRFEVVFVGALKRSGFISNFIRRRSADAPEEMLVDPSLKVQREFRGVSAIVISEDGDKFEVPMTYEMGIEHAIVDTFFRIQSVSELPNAYMFIDEKSAWKAIYTLVFKCSNSLTLVVPDSYKDKEVELLNTIAETRWKVGLRTTSLTRLLSSTSLQSQKRQKI